MLRLLPLAACLAALASSAATCQEPRVILRAELLQTRGWMPDGWGGYRFVLRNEGSVPVRVTRWTARWQARGTPMGEPWGGELSETLAPGKELVRDEVGLLPGDVYRVAKPEHPMMCGTFTIAVEDRETVIPFRLPVPGAELPEPLRRVEGETVALALMESRFREFMALPRTLAWMDACYESMIQLTGERPFGGRKMVFREAPPHPWWAYAGEEMILNTDYVASTLKDFDDGLISFGWVHEVGHNFDTLGEWYIWNAASAEFQANFKLAHAFETIADQSFRIKWTFVAPGYPPPDKSLRLSGPEFVERFFLLFGDGYLADAGRDWLSLSSDEMHSFFQRLQRCYGWEPFRRWYRTYRRLHDAGKKPPESPEEKLRLAAAILARETGVDLVPVFQRWRFPVDAASVRTVAEKYLDDAGGSARQTQ